MDEIKLTNGGDDNQLNEGPKNFSKGYLTFPFDQEQFKDFIVGLLGKPQSITKRIQGSFEIQLKDLQNLHDLINQRVLQQNKGRLIQFTAKVHFDDNSSVQLGSYDELITYNEVKPIISDGVKLTWDYLIQFSDKKYPEKQVIEIVIISTDEKMFIGGEELSILLPSHGEFRISIEHTARSWGSDIESILTNQIKSMLKPEDRLKRFIRNHSGKIGLTFSIIFFLVAIIGAYVITHGFIMGEIQNVREFIEVQSKSIDEKLNFLASYLANGTASQHYFKVGTFLLISMILSIAVGTWIEDTASSNREPSFIILTRKSKENRDRIVEKMKRRWRWFFISLAISVLTGVLSNFIFKWIVERN